MGVSVGIDLGTTFSAVAIIDKNTNEPKIVPNKEGEKITPSVIQFVKDYKTGVVETVVGAEAKEAFDMGEDGCVSTFKRFMGIDKEYYKFDGKSYTSIDLSAILLKYLKEGAELSLNDTIDEAVITVPAYFEDKERRATLAAAKKAGLKVRIIINEPSAAALTFGINHWRENAKILVYDLGGGTFDVTLVQMGKNGHLKSIKTKGDHILGGKDWDARILSMLKENIEEETGYDANSDSEFSKELMGIAENIKKKLTISDIAAININVPEFGTYSAKITLEDFESNTIDLLSKTGGLCNNILDEIGISWNDITDILLVGGSTRMRQVSKYLEKISNGHKPLSQVNPDEAVALGAAIQTTMPIPKYSVYSEDDKKSSSKPVLVAGTVGSKSTKVTSLSMDDVQAHAMGIILENEDGTAYINANIIPEDQTVPVKRALACKYYTSSKRPNELEIYVLQGRKAPADSIVSHKFVAEGIRHVKGRGTILKVQYSYDRNGLIHVQVRQENDKFDLKIREEAVPDDMSEFEKPIVHEKEEFRVYLIIDTSGSMDGEPMAEARNAMRNFVSELEGTGTKIGLMLVADSTYIQLKPTDNYQKCYEAIDIFDEDQCSWGNSAHPFDTLYGEFNNIDGRKMAVVLADGRWDRPDIAINAAQKCHDAGIEIAGVGFGYADKSFIQAISSTSADAVMTIQSELSQTFGTIARSLGPSESKHGSSGLQTETETWEAPDEM